MAIGLGLMMGFEFKENFNHPYISQNITEFWRRWHISLSTWLRDYLYVPLGGNRKGPVRTYVNLGLTMLLGGIWHGANWTFVVWGTWHGVILAIERRLGGPRFGVPATMLLVMIGWIVFRAPDLDTALAFYAAMLGTNGLALSDVMRWQVSGLQATMLVVGIGVVYAAPYWRRWKETLTGERAARWRYTSLAYIPLFLVAVMRLSAQSYSPFLYFQF
jgi:alginate O-acetyltransferase complex protein AlgI